MSKRKRSTELSGSALRQGAAFTAVASDDRERIERRAYELYVERGCGDGQAVDDWCRAEREIRAGADARVES